MVVLPGSGWATGNDHGTGCSRSRPPWRGPPGPGGRRIRGDQGGQGASSPGPWPGARMAPRAPATAPSTISGGRGAVGWATDDAARHRSRGSGPRERRPRTAPPPDPRRRLHAAGHDRPRPGRCSSSSSSSPSASCLVQSPAPVKHSDAAVGCRGSRCGPSRPPGCSRRSSSGEPPTNILNAVSVPVGSVRLSHQNNSGGRRPVRLAGDLPLRRFAGGAAGLLRRGHEAPGLAGLRPGGGHQRPGRARGPGQAGGLGRLLLGHGRDGLAHDVQPRAGPPTASTDFTIRLLQEDDPD